MSTPKRHHYVPKFLLRRFVNSKGSLFIFDKRRTENVVFSPGVDNAFVQKYLNTFELEDGTKNVDLELGYAKLEGEAKRISDRIIDGARQGKEPGLSPDDRNLWDNFTYHQQKRAPDAFQRLGLLNDIDKTIEKKVAELEQSGRKLSDAEKANVRTPEASKRIVQRASVMARAAGSQEVINALADRGLAIAVITNSSQSFVIGDHPQGRMGPDGDIRDAETELWLPISPDVAVSPWGDEMTETLIYPKASAIRRVNETIFKISNVVAARSEQLLRSLANI